MFYVRRDERGVVRGLNRWPPVTGPIERLNVDDPEVMSYLEPQSSATAGPVLRGAQFEAALVFLNVTYDALEGEIDIMSGLTDPQRAYHRARCRRGERYRRDDPVIVPALRALGATDAELDKAWAAAKDLAGSEAV